MIRVHTVRGGIVYSFLCCYSHYIFAFALVLFCSAGYSADFYHWTDDSGNFHLSDTLEKVPEKYRSQIEKQHFGNDEEKKEGSEQGTPAPSESLAGPHAQRRHAGVWDQTTQPLKRYEVPYRPFEGSARRVIVEATFNNSVTAPMAIDTGAPGTVISVALAEKLGLLDESHGRLYVAARGIGGTARAMRSIIDDIRVGEARSHFVPTTITAGLSNSFEGLLGLDFVSNYSVTIDSKRRVVMFEELPDDPDSPGGHDQGWWRNIFGEFASSRTYWKNVSSNVDKKMRESVVSGDAQLTAAKDFADYQYREAEKLFDKLDDYARENAVPMHWREY
jgi:hypothetical protein